MITRGKDEDDTICHDAHTMALRRANRTHEFNTIMNLRKVFGHFFGIPKILPSLTKLLPKPEKLNRWSYDGFRCPHEWPDVYTIRPEFEHFHNRVSIWCQVRDSVTPALRISGYCICSVALPQGAVGWSAVYDCANSWSYSLIFVWKRSLSV